MSKFRGWTTDDMFSFHSAVRVLGLVLDRVDAMGPETLPRATGTLRKVHANLQRLLPAPDTFEGAALERVHRQIMGLIGADNA